MIFTLLFVYASLRSRGEVLRAVLVGAFLEGLIELTLVITLLLYFIGG